MRPSLALLLWVALLLGLFCFDPAREPKTSAALWVPVIWLSFLGSRIPSNWLGLSYVSDAVQALELLVRPARSVGVARIDGDNVLEAHNGYLAIFLDLGLISLCLLCTFLIATYRKICKRLKPFTPRGSLGLDFWAVLVF